MFLFLLKSSDLICTICTIKFCTIKKNNISVRLILTEFLVDFLLFGGLPPCSQINTQRFILISVLSGYSLNRDVVQMGRGQSWPGSASDVHVVQVVELCE